MSSHSTSQPGDGSSRPRVIAGRYRLESVLGQGAMGTVWAAYDELLYRRVAVKEFRLPRDLPEGAASRLRERTLREARTIAGISHPNVITLYDVVSEGGEPFIVMELLPARSLAGIIAEHGPLTVTQAATIADAVAAALQAAAAAGVTHRDVKPANVLVCRDGRATLTDFGIAGQAAEIAGAAGRPMAAERPPEPGNLLLGSPAYMAPEVASGERAGQAADLWGLGATLFAALTGRPPYDVDDDPVATASAVARGEVPAPPPGPLAPIVSRLMNPDPHGRPDPTRVREALTPYRAAPGEEPFPATLFAGTRPGTAEQAGRAGGASGDEPSGGAVDGAGGEQPPPAPLATDPGPLPAELPAPTGSRRRLLATAGLAATAVLAYGATATAGFALTRWLGGSEVLPPAAASDGTGYAFETRTGDAGSARGSGRALFTVDVPRGWATFVSRHALDQLPVSTRTRFVSGDGRAAIAVERFPGFFDDLTIDDYLDVLGETVYPAGFDVVHRARTSPLANVGPAEAVTYRAVAAEREPGSPAQHTTTVARLADIDEALWVLGITAPRAGEERATTMLDDRVAPSFTVLGS
ncbi:serine/threonine-protein kinase [Haloechinothrix sp. LS1_15]|uniref:serine/threonine-protein kinase n=1 Tax=Haloechinothrix sp. LS1_15 TaxID=2652248 RepID=UPI002947DD7B|nr:serine/threonine-protein kinase [Haloechinothrix sp. LS1_15]MDV6012969.1 serine/threonine protein kinase [Haloechinothrix sp. LS1_15]